MLRPAIRCMSLSLLLAGGACAGKPAAADGGSAASSSSGTSGAGASSGGASSVGGSSTGAGSTGGSGGSSSGGSTSSTGGGSSGGAACLPGTACALDGGGAGSCCAGRCTDLASDPGNCGACGSPCYGKQICTAGSCLDTDCATGLPGDSCKLGLAGTGSCCRGVCAGSFDDDRDCGGCGVICPAGSSCSGGACADDAGNAVSGCGSGCPAGGVCSLVQSFCIDASCADGGAFCQLGNGGLGACCAGACADIFNSPSNCGGCGVTCSTGRLCVHGSCVIPGSCTAGSQGGDCALAGAAGGGVCCGAACADSYGDPANCGGCGLACPPGTACVQGACLLPDGGTACSAAACPPGSVCSIGPPFGSAACITPCGADGDQCPLAPGRSGLCCGGACVDPVQDPANCGGCGLACASGVCQREITSGVCAPASPPDGGCGGCPAGDACIEGLCVARSCPQTQASLLCALDGGLASCCFVYLLANGNLTPEAYCADLSTDPQNCGACGNSCFTGLACQGGICGPPGDAGACAGREGDRCALGDGGPGLCCGAAGCVDPTADLANCGYCGDDCTLLGADACFASYDACGATSCPGQPDGQLCPLDGGLGLCCGGGCIDWTSDPADCGGCGVRCDGGACVGGNCQ
ncbi:MAG: hypothetical protein ACYDCL_11865 [Myxococcales bacterium]